MNSETGSLYVLIEWPESQEFMDAPGAFLVEDPNIAGPSAYMVPVEVFEHYVDNCDDGNDAGGGDRSNQD